ncbi:uncharacterized protein [Ptychodera flava]|uniref:uncharacterized protein n=1 Tax=Ptychodera flava TaxID=63121 RepID=UPI00396A4D1E
MTTSAVVLCLFSVSLLFASPARSEDVAANLKKLIEDNFSQNRHHTAGMQTHIAARDFIKKTFEDYGLEVKLKSFPTSDTTTNGTNVIGVLRGTNSGTSNDSVLLVGAHYDTTATTPGVDNNGSGLAALLEMLRLLLQSTTGCVNSNTMIFVAFDSYEEDDNSCPEGMCGSKYFVGNALADYIGEGSFQGAIILDSIMNFDPADNSQEIFLQDPSGQFDPFNNQLQDEKFVGNFLFCTTRHADADRALLTAFVNEWEALPDDVYKIKQLPLNIAEPPTEDQLSIEFLFDGDHAAFWENEPAYSALYLTDTKGSRGVMKECYHNQCDNTTLLTTDNLNFLAKTTKALTNAVNKMAECKDKDTSLGNSLYSAQASLGLFLSLVAFLAAI